MSCRLAFIALTELGYLTKERSQDQIDIVESHTFQYYRISMQYMFVMEFTKLLEPDTKGTRWERFENRHASSLAKLSRKINEAFGTSFARQHDDNINILKDIRDSGFYGDVKEKRDEEFAHTDANRQDPLKITSFSTEEIDEAFKLMEKLKCVLDNCTSVYGYDFIFDQDTTTDNFIIYHAMYQSYYDKHLNQAVSEGFHIKPKS